MKKAFGSSIGMALLCTALPALADPPPQSLDDLLGPPDASSSAPAPSAAPAAPPAPESPAPPAASAPAAPVPSPPAAVAVPAPADTGPLPIKPAAAERNPAHNRVVEEIVVTAQKREENLQDVPISVAAFSGDALEARGVDNPTALSTVTPGLTYNTLVGYSLIYIRGVGSDAFEPTADASVATYIDGVYLPFAHGLAQNFVKLQRIEVLKGPQGTLFGRNTTGGAINIVTRKPSDTLEGSIDGAFGSFRDREVKGFLTGPIVHGLNASLNVMYTRDDPYYKLLPASPIQGLNTNITKGVDLRLQWEPTENLSFTMSELLTLSNGAGSIVNQAENPKPLGQLALIQGIPQPRETSLDYNPNLGANNHLYYAQAAWTPQWLDVKLLGSEQLVHTDLTYDFDSSPQPLVYFHASNQFTRVATGELQFLSKPGGIFPHWMQFTGGLYYFHSAAGYLPVIFGVGPGAAPLFLSAGLADPLLALIPPGLPIPTSGVQLTLFSTLKTRAEAGYLQTTFYLTDWLDFTVGARYQHEIRGTTQADSDLTTSSGPLTLLPFPLASATRYSLSPKATVDIKPWEGQLFYASIQQASKSGTFNLPAIYTAPRFVKPEVVTAYEIGNKGLVFDGSLRYSAAIFINEIRDLQTQIVSLQSGGAQNLVNANRANIKGADVDATWDVLPQFISGLALTASFSYIDGKYTSFPDGSGFDPTTGLFFGDGSLTLSPARDFTGNAAVRTPKISYTIGPSYAMNVPGGSAEAGMDYSHNSGYFFDTQNTVRQPPYHVVNARLSYLYQPINLRLTLFGKNLTGANYYLNRFQTDFATNSLYAAPRTLGVRLSWEFK